MRTAAGALGERFLRAGNEVMESDWDESSYTDEFMLRQGLVQVRDDHTSHEYRTGVSVFHWCPRIHGQHLTPQ